MARLDLVMKWYIMFVIVGGAKAECFLKFPGDRRSMPSYKKTFGSKWIKIPYSQQNAVIRDGEHIDVFCESGISDFLDVYEERSDTYPYRQETANHLLSGLHRVNIYCQGTTLHYTDGHALLENELNCASLQWNMYEAANPFSWCESEMSSYLLATKSMSRNLILAATCFDIQHMTVRNLHYFIGPNRHTVDYNELPSVTPSELINATLGPEVEHFQSLFDPSRETVLKEGLQEKSMHNEWLKVVNFEYDSIVQGDLYAEYFNKYESLLKIPWWPNLRNGNWRRFVRALDQRSNSHAYNLYAGTSGAVRLPQRNKCSPNDVLELPFGDVNETIPAYVWTYVQAVDGLEEFVVVGYNSPFFNFYPEDEVIFCEDICSSISWLNDISSTFRYSAIGVVFCCEVEAVRTANSLQGFPLKVEPVNTTTTAFPALTEALSASTENTTDRGGEVTLDDDKL